MKALLCMFVFALTAAGVGSALAKSTAKTISATVTIVNGRTVSVYLNGGTLLTSVVQRGSYNAAQPGGALPLVRIGFDFPSSWYFVKRVTWDKYKKHLTIDF